MTASDVTADLLPLGSASRLDELEDVVERGLSTFVEVGEALLEIRDSRLYRLAYGTWEDYLSERWQMSRQRGYQLIDAAAVTRALSTTVDMPEPLTERVARELVPVMREDPVSLPAVMAAAVERAGDRPVTAADVRAEVRDRMRSMAAESEAEMQAATAHYTDEQRAAVAPEQMRQRGELARLIGDVAALPDAADYARRHGIHLGSDFFANAMVACGWLETFCDALEGER